MVNPIGTKPKAKVKKRPLSPYNLDLFPCSTVFKCPDSFFFVLFYHLEPYAGLGHFPLFVFTASIFTHHCANSGSTPPVSARNNRNHNPLKSRMREQATGPGTHARIKFRLQTPDFAHGLVIWRGRAVLLTCME